MSILTSCTDGFGPVGTGNVYIAALVADFIAAAMIGPLTDFSAVRRFGLSPSTLSP